MQDDKPPEHTTLREWLNIRYGGTPYHQDTRHWHGESYEFEIQSRLVKIKPEATASGGRVAACNEVKMSAPQIDRPRTTLRLVNAAFSLSPLNWRFGWRHDPLDWDGWWWLGLGPIALLFEEGKSNAGR